MRAHVARISRARWRFSAPIAALTLVASVLMPQSLAAPRPAAAAACGPAWSNLLTASKTVQTLPKGGPYTVTVKYKVEWDTCIWKYTRIYVSSVTNTHTITTSLYPNSRHINYERALLRDCSGLQTGCLVYPGEALRYDGTPLVHVGNGTWTITWYPNITYAWARTTAVWDAWAYETNYMDPGLYTRFAFQFLRGTIEIG